MTKTVIPPGIPRMLLLLTTTMIVGCSSDARYAELARNSLEQQAAQNQAMTRQNQELTEATRRLVESDAEARRKLFEMQEQLQTGVQSERRELDRQREDLEQDRRELAQTRHREPILAAALVQVALLLVAALPLLIAVYLLRAVQDDDSEAAMAQLLVHELTSDRPLLLPSTPPRLVGPATPALSEIAEPAEAESSPDDGDPPPPGGPA